MAHGAQGQHVGRGEDGVERLTRGQQPCRGVGAVVQGQLAVDLKRGIVGNAGFVEPAAIPLQAFDKLPVVAVQFADIGDALAPESGQMVDGAIGSAFIVADDADIAGLGPVEAPHHPVVVTVVLAAEVLRVGVEVLGTEEDNALGRPRQAVAGAPVITLALQ